jgi:hypothetical protein
MPGVKPAASGGRNLADWHVKGWSLTCLVHDTGVKASRDRSGRRETLGGRSVALGRPSTGKPSLHIRAPGMPSPLDLKSDVTATLVYVPTKTGGRPTRPLENDLHALPMGD